MNYYSEKIQTKISKREKVHGAIPGKTRSKLPRALS